VGVRNFDGDYENEDKEPVAVMLGWDRGRVVYAPCTVCPDDTKTVPHGSILLTRDSQRNGKLILRRSDVFWRHS